MTELEQMGQRALEASRITAKLKINDKNNALNAIAAAIVEGTGIILAANDIDIQAAKAAGMKEGLVDRLMLNPDRIKAMAEGITQISALDDPVGEVLGMWERPNGLCIGQKRVPIGVIGIIYESRPNVTLDAFGLCFKAGNAVINNSNYKGHISRMRHNTRLYTINRKYGQSRYQRAYAS